MLKLIIWNVINNINKVWTVTGTHGLQTVGRRVKRSQLLPPSPQVMICSGLNKLLSSYVIHEVFFHCVRVLMLMKAIDYLCS